MRHLCIVSVLATADGGQHAPSLKKQSGAKEEISLLLLSAAGNTLTVYKNLKQPHFKKNLNYAFNL